MKNDVIRAILRLAIDYFRWTQLLPMLAAWGFLLLALFAIALTSFEDQATALLEAFFAAFGAVYRLLPDSLTGVAEDGSLRLSGDDLISALSWAWFVLSGIAMIVNWLVGERLRPDFLTTLSGRIKTAGFLAAGVSVLVLVIRVLVPENFGGPIIAWLPTLIGGPLIVWIISVYSLSVSAALSFVDAKLVAAIDV